MPLYRNNDRTILFVHIPKTGGSSIEEMLVTAGAAQALKFHKRLRFSSSTPQHMQWKVTQHWVSPAFYDYSLAIVRNPYARLVSEYCWRCEISETTPPEFNAWVVDILEKFQKNNYILDNHIRPQVEFVGPKVTIFRLEDGLQAPVKASFEQLRLSTQTIEMHHTRKSQHHVRQVTQETLDRIATFYAADFAAYEYSVSDLPQGLFDVISNPQPPSTVAPPVTNFWRKLLGQITR